MAHRVLIMGAAGKDFHVFNTVYRGRDDVHVVCFTATQIPGIDDRKYPAVLAGPGYPDGIEIKAEDELVDLIKEHKVDEVIFAYSDVTYDYVAAKRKLVEDAGAKFNESPVDECMIKSTKPVIAICAVRTGCGKSQTTRRVAQILKDAGKKVVAIRHPMPYGDLAAQAVQRFASVEDLKKHDCTIEEMEEYEPHITSGTIIYAGVDYEAIVREAEKEADVILWDGGNNDIPFYKPDLWLTVVDPHRPGHELSYYPGKVNAERADVLLFNKMETAKKEDVKVVEENLKKLNPDATVVYANSPVTAADPSVIKGKRVLVVEDGPTLTHGGMKYGAGVIAARKYGAAEIVDPRPWTVGEISDTFKKYPDIGALLPAMGYGDKQVKDLEQTIAAAEVDSVVIGTPIDLSRVVKIDKPATRITYELDDYSKPSLDELVRGKLEG
jgi:predicted GTPase